MMMIINLSRMLNDSVNGDMFVQYILIFSFLKFEVILPYAYNALYPTPNVRNPVLPLEILEPLREGRVPS